MQGSALWKELPALLAGLRPRSAASARAMPETEAPWGTKQTSISKKQKCYMYISHFSSIFPSTKLTSWNTAKGCIDFARIICTEWTPRQNSVSRKNHCFMDRCKSQRSWLEKFRQLRWQESIAFSHSLRKLFLYFFFWRIVSWFFCWFVGFFFFVFFNI